MHILRNHVGGMRFVVASVCVCVCVCVCVAESVGSIFTWLHSIILLICTYYLMLG